MSLERKNKDKFPDLDTSGWLLPTTIEKLAESVKSHNRLQIGGSNPYRLSNSRRDTSYAKNENGDLIRTEGPPLNPPYDGRILLDELTGVLWFSPENQLVSVKSGTLLTDLNHFLREHDYEIPVGLNEVDQEECIGDLIAMNLPHWNLAQGGSWRDWVVKMKIVLANGEVVVSGADVVKNVTGFDLHKLIVGARHTLGIIAEVTLRLRPARSHQQYPPLVGQHGELVLAPRSSFREIKKRLMPDIEKGSLECYFDEESCLILTEQTRSFEDIPHFSWRSHVYEYALPEFSEVEQRLMKRTKEIFDPTYKLNPGEFGFL